MATVLDAILANESNHVKEDIHGIVESFLDSNDFHDWSAFRCGYEDYDDTYYDGTYSYDIQSGATKCVLIPNGASYVIKIPFSGAIEWDDDSDYDYQGAYSDELENENDNDYCELEAALYEKSVDWGLQDFFVPTAFFGIIKGFPVYVQVRVNVAHHRAAESYRQTYRTIEGSILFDDYIGAALVEFYGTQKVAKLLRFFDYYGINDVDNYRNGGYDIEYKRHVFWDYAGFAD